MTEANKAIPAVPSLTLKPTKATSPSLSPSPAPAQKPPLSARILGAITGRKYSYKRHRSFASENANLISSLTPEQVETYKRVFKLFDIDKDDMINTAELGTALRSLGLTPTDDEVRDMIREVDVDDSGDIQFDEFLALMARGAVNTSIDAQVREVFDTFDLDGDGFLSTEDIRESIYCMGGRKISDGEAEDIILECKHEDDPPKNPKMSYEEFVELMCMMNIVL